MHVIVLLKLELCLRTIDIACGQRYAIFSGELLS